MNDYKALASPSISTRARIFIIALLLFIAASTRLAAGADAAANFQNPMEATNLDDSAFSQWVDGAETPVDAKNGIRHLLWTRDSTPEWDGVKFGDIKTPGVRHMRLAWKQPVEIGAVLVRGGGRLSALRADTAYPGNMNDQAAWIPAMRIKGDRVGQDEAGEDDYAVWVFPAKIKTRALRFTHDADAADRSYAGWLGGAFVLSDRYVNVAPQALVRASAHDEHSRLLNNETNDHTWGAWENAEHGAAEVVSPEHPEWITFVYPKPMTIDGLCALWAGFSDCDVQVYSGPPDRNPAEASEADWQTIRHWDKIENQYPRALPVNFTGFDKPVVTRAMRLRITHASTESHPHLNGRIEKGKRVWLGELMALSPLGNKPIESALPERAAPAGHPPIAIHFSLKEAGFVTLVIEDAAGKRIRNLISETSFPAGENTAWWDGLDDLGRDTEAAHHGLYATPGKFVAAGDYRVRGLFRKGVDLRFEFSVYNSGQPAWETADSTGAWLSNHTPPSSTLFIPADKAPGGKPLVYLGSYVTEGGHGLAWVNLDGRKQGGRGWVGGNWTGAPYLARDAGESPAKDIYAYAGAAWETDLRLTALSSQGDKPVVKYAFPGGKNDAAITGLAVHNGLLACSLPKEKRVMFIDVKAGAIVGSTALDDPRGLAFDSQGRLLALSGKRLLRSAALASDARKSVTISDVVIADGLEDPQLLTFDKDRQIYISDRGGSHQVKVFSPDGSFLRAIGHPGEPKAGPYDVLHMNNPAGVTIDSNDHLWVAETDFQPKRVSVWTLDGKLVTAFYGPSEYGGGGVLDSQDKNRFFFHGMEFKLDWKTGENQIVRIFHRPGPADQKLPDGYGTDGLPETPIYADGHRYFTNCNNSNPTGGAPVIVLWIDRNGVAVPTAAMGRAGEWSVLKGDAFKARWPEGVDPNGRPGQNSACFVWSDINGDGHVQPEEIQMIRGDVGGITVMPDLAMVSSRVADRCVRIAPQKFNADGTPIYSLASAETLVAGTQTPTSSGGDQALTTADGWTVLTIAPKPYGPQSVGGVYKGEPLWSYPSMWPGLHASHESAAPDRPGELVGTTRLLGGFITPHDSDAGPVFAVNGNMGNMYLMTADGLFVATLFHDVRQGQLWAMPTAQRNMRLNDLTLHDENFWPTISQTPDGNVYMVDGGRSSLVRVDGLETIRRLPASTVHVSENDLKSAQSWQLNDEAQRQKQQGRRVLHVAMKHDAPTVDGKFDEWKDADWAVIDRRGVAANFDARTKPYDVTAAVAVAGDRLYAAYHTGEERLLENSGEVPAAPFKTGGALDLMIGTSPAAADNRNAPAPGDIRLLVTLVKGKPLALLYNAVVPGTKEPVPFSSPWRTITIDKIDDVTSQLQFAGDKGDFEFSIPLSAIGLVPAAGKSIRADIGLLRGSGFQTTQRVYWNNKATAITADVPSEAELTPALWGRWEFVGSN